MPAPLHRMPTAAAAASPRSRPRSATLAACAAVALLGVAGPARAAAGEPSGPPTGGEADLRVDTDRDGNVDVTGDGDEAGEDTWAPERGAILLPNMDDDERRCRRTGGKPPSDAASAACRDGADAVVNGARDAADLARMRTVPIPGAGDQARGTVAVTGAAAPYTHVFLNRGGRWVMLKPADALTAAELRGGVELGIEATDVVRDGRRWDGQVAVRLTVTGTTTPSHDTVMLRVAPVLTHHHLQPVQQVAVTALRDAAQKRFVAQLEEEVRAAGIPRPMIKFTKYGDPWAQDFVEPAYLGMPGPDGRPVVMRLLIRSAQPTREAGRELFERLRGPDVGVLQVDHEETDDEDTSLNSMGNLETVPPHAHNGRSYPAGRIIMGQRPEQRRRPAAEMLTMLRSQGLQDPLLLDTGWLSVGHVDEFVQFLPAKTPRGWRIAVADPELGLGLLNDAARAGQGRTPVFHGLRKDEKIPTIAAVLTRRPFLAANALAARKIKENLAVLQRETGVTDEEITRVPALFSNDSGEGDDAASGARDQREAAGETDPARRRLRAMTTMSAYVPGAVNGVVLGDSRYLAPDPHGPVVGGKDIFREAIAGAYAGAGFTTRFIDDWYTYHVGGGEVHCGTNTLRDAGDSRWWTRS